MANKHWWYYVVTEINEKLGKQKSLLWGYEFKVIKTNVKFLIRIFRGPISYRFFNQTPKRQQNPGADIWISED